MRDGASPRETAPKSGRRNKQGKRTRRAAGPLFTHAAAHKLTGRIERGLYSKMEALPFVKIGGPGVCSFWNVRPRSDCAEECELGRPLYYWSGSSATLRAASKAELTSGLLQARRAP